MSVRVVTAAVISTAAAVITAAGVLASAVTADASPAATCRPHTSSVSGETAARAIATVAANIPAACGFSVSGSLSESAFGTDGAPLLAPAGYDGKGDLHVVTANQGVVTDFYQVGGHAYLRLYEYDSPSAAPDPVITGLWNLYGVTSKAVIDAAGSTKWIELTAAQRKKFSIAPFGSASSLAAAIAAGNGKPWKLGGTATVGSVRCVVLTEVINNATEFAVPAETMDVAAATGLPVRIHFSGLNGISLYAQFSDWSHVTVTAPPSSKVVAGS
jgi:hypothetical protein